jgi:hypothetical protein
VPDQLLFPRSFLATSNPLIWLAAQQPLFKIRIAESLQIDFFGTLFPLLSGRLRRLGLMDFIIITFFQRRADV